MGGHKGCSYIIIRIFHWFISERKVGFDLNKDMHGHAEIMTRTGIGRLGHVAKRKTKDLQFWRRDPKISR